MRGIDLLDKSTHRNWPSPQLDRSFVNALTDIVGLNPHGEPNARFVWAQEHLRYQWGKKRLAYIDNRIPAIRHSRHVLKRTTVIETKTVSVPVAVVDGMIEYEDRVKEVPRFERKILTEAPRIIPEGWIYELELLNLEWIGEQMFCLEQWYPAEHFGTEAQWNRHRFKRWPFEWAPEPDVQIALVGDADSVTEDEDGHKTIRRLRGGVVDAIGPYPVNGDYRALRWIGEPYEYERPTLVGPKGYQVHVFIPDTHLAFRMPGRDTLEAVKEAWKDRETRRQYSAEALGRMRVDRYTEAEDVATAENARLNHEALEDRRTKIQVGYGS